MELTYAVPNTAALAFLCIFSVGVARYFELLYRDGGRMTMGPIRYGLYKK